MFFFLCFPTTMEMIVLSRQLIGKGRTKKAQGRNYLSWPITTKTNPYMIVVTPQELLYASCTWQSLLKTKSNHRSHLHWYPCCCSEILRSLIKLQRRQKDRQPCIYQIVARLGSFQLNISFISHHLRSPYLNLLHSIQ